MADELRFAVFGESGAGKSAFISSFYGNLSSEDFKSANEYNIICPDGIAKKKLQSAFLRMRDHHVFPKATSTAEMHSFKVGVDGFRNDEFLIKWSDYPGGWWANKSDNESEEQERKRQLKELLCSHVGVLLIDGQKYASDSTGYVRELLSRFDQRFRDIIQEAKNIFGRTDLILPGTWIVAVTKADILSDGLTAKVVHDILVRDAILEINSLQNVLGAGFGDNLVIFSAVKASGQKVLSAHEHLGLQLFAPVGLAQFIDDCAKRDSDNSNLLDSLSNMVAFFGDIIGNLPINIPANKKGLLKEVVKLLFKEGVHKKAQEHLAEMANIKKENKEYLEYILAAFHRHLADPTLSRLHYRDEA